ncbi:peptidylprolyl isomerase [Streptomyces sp. NPDC096013]|uniref:peptidylprolyl isomerase n=1 Tax=Streptomyces sp. NPDC096013 TaxID=3366069 RepID=UPI0037FD97A0
MAEARFATLNTTLGGVVVGLFPDEAPETVANFVGLAEGTKQWRHPQTGASGKGSLYNGTLFHRVIDGFMIQGGDPQGDGRGGPGYRFKDEFHPTLKFDRPYLLAMANAGPGTNGSQFFITLGPVPHLNNRHTIFGEVIEGQDIVTAIASRPTDGNDRPRTDITIESITIERR